METFVLFFHSAYSACYPETPTARQLAVNPGNYVTTSLTATHCEDACSGLGYSLAGLTAGKACFCGNTMTESTASEGSCVQTCAGDGEKCGTDGEPPYDSVYTTPVVLNGFKIFPGGEIIYTCTLSLFWRFGWIYVLYKKDFSKSMQFAMHNIWYLKNLIFLKEGYHTVFSLFLFYMQWFFSRLYWH